MKASRGFTIPELLISVFIIVLMTAIALPNWRSGETTLALDRAAHKLGQDIRKATELAQRAQALTPPLTCVPGTISGYGVYFSISTPSYYVLYAECEGNEDYGAGDTIVQTIMLENKIQLASTTTPSSFSVLFVPPVPTITIQPADPENPDRARVILSVEGDLARSKTITITTKGIIDID